MYKFKLKEITMDATGCFVESYPYSKEGRWNINYSGILSDLICKAGRYCKHYASDLFIDWKEIENSLDNADYKGDTYLFGFFPRRDDFNFRFFHLSSFNQSSIRFFTGTELNSLYFLAYSIFIMITSKLLNTLSFFICSTFVRVQATFCI